MKQQVSREDNIDNGLYWESLTELQEFVTELLNKYRGVDIENISIEASVVHEYGDSYSVPHINIAYQSEETDEEYEKRVSRESIQQLSKLTYMELVDKGVSNNLANTPEFQKLYQEGKLKF